MTVSPINSNIPCQTGSNDQVSTQLREDVSNPIDKQLKMGTYPEFPNAFDTENSQSSTKKRSLRALSSAEINIISTINEAFKNWYNPWKETYLNEGEEFAAVYDSMETLLHYEKQILSSESVLSNERINAIGQAVTRLVDYGNAILNIDIIIRHHQDETSCELEPSQVTTIELYQAHIRAQKLRDKLLLNYFKKETLKRFSDDGDIGSASNPSCLQIPLNTSHHSNLPSPTLDRSRKLSTGSNISINTLVPMASPTPSHDATGRRTPSRTPSNSSATQSFIELRHPEAANQTVSDASSDNDLSNNQLELRRMITTIRSSAFANAINVDSRRALLPGILSKLNSLFISNQTEKITHRFEILNALLDVIEKLPSDSRKDEVYMIADSLLKPLVKNVFVDDRDNCIEFQHSHWTTYLLSLIRLLTSLDFNSYLRTFPNLPDLSAFLKDYLFIVKRFTATKSNTSLEVHEPIFPNCWIEMNLLVCSTFLKSMIHLYQTLRQCFASNSQMWNSYIDCLVHFILHDSLRPNRPMFKNRQSLLAHDLRKTSADYIWIAWDPLNFDQKQQIIEDLIEPLLRCCMILNSSQRSILLPIFYDMMRCDYTSQYLTPKGGGSTSGTITGLKLSPHHSSIDSREDNFMYEEDFVDCFGGTFQREISDVTQSAAMRQNSGESLPYLSFKGTNNSSSDDGTVLTKFTHLIVGKLNHLMVDLNLGDDQFKDELCAAISGHLDPKYTLNNQLYYLSSAPSYSIDINQFKNMARHTSDLVAEFMQICLDLRQANRLSYSHFNLLCLFKLVLFFRDKVDRIDLYLSNLHKLWCLHHAAGRYVEAGFTLLEHAKSIPWSERPLESHYRIITRSFQTQEPLTDHISLKIFLYTTIIEYFNEGQLWEAAVPLCRELIDIYQYRTYDYLKLADILDRLSKFFANIISNGNTSSSCRAHPEYFRVTFYGQGFPECIRGSTMVYRGKPFEKLSDFQAILLSKYSDSKLLLTLAKPTDEILNNPESKYLQINACSPIVDLKSKFGSRNIDKIPDQIVDYYKRNECDKFEYSRRINRNDATIMPSSMNEFANIWRERTTLTTNSLPGMLPFFPVFLEETKIISPIECAIEDLKRTNDRLSSMVSRFKADKRHEEDVRPLGQLLLGIVDAAVNGGITKYEEAFFSAHAGCDRGSHPKTFPPSSEPQQTQVLLTLSSSPTLESNFTSQLTVSCNADNIVHQQQPQKGTIWVEGQNSTCDQQQTSIEQMETLKTLIARQVPLLDEAIRLHRDRVAEIMLPQHEHLETSFKKLKYHIMSKYSRYLPTEYARSTSSSMRSYRSLARSPHRSTRSESRLSSSQLNSTLSSSNSLLRFSTKRLSDASSAKVVVGQQEGDNEQCAINSTNIPYRQLNNERRSLPFITVLPAVNWSLTRDSEAITEGFPSCRDERRQQQNRQSRHFLGDSDVSDQGVQSLDSTSSQVHHTRRDSNHQAPDRESIHVSPSIPPPASINTKSRANASSILITRAAPPPPPQLTASSESPYVCVADLLRKAVGSSGGRGLPYARLDNSRRQSYDQSNSRNNEFENESGSRTELSLDSGQEQQQGDETRLVSL